MRIPLCVGNWKMQGTIAEGRALAASIRDGLKRPRGVDVVICPPFTALAAVNEVLSYSAATRRSELSLGGGGRAHRRDLPPHARGSGLPLRAGRALGAAP